MRFILTAFLVGLVSTCAYAQGAAGSPADVVILESKLQSVLGGVRNGKLIDAKTAAYSLGGHQDFRYYGFIRPNVSEFRVLRGEGASIPCEEFFAYQTAAEPKVGIAFSSNLSWNPVPRTISSISPTSRIYREIVRKFLRTKGLLKPKVSIKRAVRVDLDGDGTDEVVIVAENYSAFGPSARKDEYSLVFVRKIIGGKVKDIEISGDYVLKDLQFGAPNKHELSAIADLDGDGDMEIVIYGEYYEGIWSEAYEIEGGTAKKVLETGCGV